MVAPPYSPAEALIPQFFAGRSVFITGATGFMGKVLVERLLTTCPEIGQLHLLMRQKKGVPPEKRLKQLKQSQVFDAVRERCPSQLDKLNIIPGDTSQPGLAISNDDLHQLQQVSVVFHSAATVKFDEPLPAAVQQNVLSVVRLMDICDTLPNMQALVHVSTAYSNPELTCVEERVYEAPMKLPKLLALLDATPASELPSVTAEYIKPKPNTYTFTKAIAEESIRSRPYRGYSVAIFRPTIVVSALRQPYPGWIENLNGPSGVIAAAGKGLLHVFLRKEDARADLLPVDIAIDTLLAVAWETAVDKRAEVRVYNCSTYDNPTTWGDFECSLRKNLRSYPLDRALWYPAGTGIHNRYIHKTMEFLLQTLPLHLAEYAMRLLGVKTQVSLITAEQKIRAMNVVLAFFALREWRFDTSNMSALRHRLTPSDREIYNLDTNSIDWEEHYKNFVKGTRKYILKEKDENIPEARRHLNRLYYIHTGFVLVTFIVFLRLLLQNRFIRDIVYGTLRFLLSLVDEAYSRTIAPW